MSDLLQAGTAWLVGQLKANAGQSVTLSRGAQSTPNVIAVMGRTLFEHDGGTGIIDRWESHDFGIAAADYQIGGVVTLPHRGDKIVAVIGGVSVTYEVTGPPGAQRDGSHFDWADGYRVGLRVHTKQVS